MDDAAKAFISGLNANVIDAQIEGARAAGDDELEQLDMLRWQGENLAQQATDARQRIMLARAEPGGGPDFRADSPKDRAGSLLRTSTIQSFGE